jgi:hypothetical protein
LHLNLKAAAEFLPGFVLQKVRENSRQYLTKDDEIVLQADEKRTQRENTQAAFHRLHQILVSSVSKDVPGVTSAEQKERVAQLYLHPVQVLMEGTANGPQGKRRKISCDESSRRSRRTRSRHDEVEAATISVSYDINPERLRKKLSTKCM